MEHTTVKSFLSFNVSHLLDENSRGLAFLEQAREKTSFRTGKHSGRSFCRISSFQNKNSRGLGFLEQAREKRLRAVIFYDQNGKLFNEKNA